MFKQRPMGLEIGDRLSYGGELCTIKFIGEIPAWPNEVALGVEWDNIQKGKHNGSFKGIKYFESELVTLRVLRYAILTMIASNGLDTGSFLKKSKKHDGTRTFYQALVDTYGTSVESKEIKIGSKIVESYGFDKLQKLQSDFSYLKNISLSRKGLIGTNEQEEELIKKHLVNLTQLDLSFNLISSWSELLKIVRNLNLEKLRLVGNIFTKDFCTNHTSSLKILDLSFTKVSSSLLEVIPSNFPNLQQLHLSDNGLNTLDEWISKLTSLNTLDISLNNFTMLPEILQQSKINALNISDNKIKITEYGIKFPHIESLDIRRNEISDFKELGLLNQIFPNLKNLRINGNPIFDDLSVDEMEVNVIARFDNLEFVNGTEISKDERTNAELYFISKANSGSEIDQSRVKSLAIKHKVHVTQSRRTDEDNIMSKLVKLRLNYQDKVVNLDTLKTIEVLKLKGTISRVFQISYVEMELFYMISNNREPINKDLSLVSSYQFDDGQDIFIQKIT